MKYLFLSILFLVGCNQNPISDWKVTITSAQDVTREYNIRSQGRPYLIRGKTGWTASSIGGFGKTIKAPIGWLLEIERVE